MYWVTRPRFSISRLSPVNLSVDVLGVPSRFGLFRTLSALAAIPNVAERPGTAVRPGAAPAAASKVQQSSHPFLCGGRHAIHHRMKETRAHLKPSLRRPPISAALHCPWATSRPFRPKLVDSVKQDVRSCVLLLGQCPLGPCHKEKWHPERFE